MSDDQPKCPVDPKTREIWLLKSKQSQAAQEAKVQDQLHTQNELKGNNNNNWLSSLLWASNSTSITLAKKDNGAVCPVPHAADASIPVDHPIVPGMPIVEATTAATGPRKITFVEPESIECTSAEVDQSLTTPSNAVAGSDSLSLEREISSIPRTSVDGNWVYPSEKQFFNAMMRKNWNPEEQDMKTVVPLHNTVNEVAWRYIQNWERGQGGDACGGIKLTSFKGDAKKITPRAWLGHYVFGKDLPFDRHDWVVNRCGKEVEYVIDFYTTPVQKEGEEPKFFMDVRPKLNSIEGWRLRVSRALGI